jgi:Rhodanese-like domain
MSPRLILPFLAMFLILWTNSGVATQSATPPVNTDKLINLQEFKEALPERAEELGASGLQALQKAGKVVIIDVRAEGSFAARHLAGSVNAPLTGLTEKTLPAIAPDKEAPVVLVCDYSFFPVRMLAMTLQAYPVLKANGYTKIYRLNLWQGKDGISSEEEQEKTFAFEGTKFTPQKPQ